MKVNELAEGLSLECLYEGDGAREVEGCYCGDLLSWVMGRASAGDVWVTIMSNVNVAAVAALADVACVILAEGVEPDEALRGRFERLDCAVFRSGMAAYELAWRIHGLLEGRQE